MQGDVRHFASPSFWECFNALPAQTQELATRNFDLLKTNPRHPSLRYKKVGRYWSVRVGRRHRALAVDGPDGPVWFWIGTHAEYDRLLN